MAASRANSPWRILRVSVTGSTNADVLARARAGEPAGLVLVADHQTAGRGRLDRRWEAPPGANLLCSILFRPASPPGEWFRATMALAVAATRAVRALGVDAAIKWPNDLLVGADKLAGVLAETDGAGAVVAGMGLNVAWPASDELPGATSLRALGVDIEVAALVELVLARLDLVLETPETLLDDYRAHCSTIGRAVRVALPDGTSVHGDAAGVDDDGHLVVEVAAAADAAPGAPAFVIRRFAVGDIIHARAV